MGMKRVIVESPYAGGTTPFETAAVRIQYNVDYAKACVLDCLRRGEAPIASHLLIAAHGILDDADPEERARGIAAGLAWYEVADACVVYTDNGISRGMEEGVRAAVAAKVAVEYRELKEWCLPQAEYHELKTPE